MQDLKFALRQLKKFPGFTATVVLTVALGIGANTAIFTLVHAVLLSSLPVADPATLYRIGDRDDCCVNGGFMNDDGDFDIFSYDLYRQFRDNTPEFEQLAAFESGHDLSNMRRSGGVAKPQRTEYVSGNYFTTFGVSAFAGRTLLPADDLPGATPVAVLRYDIWQSEYAGDRSIVGSTFYMQGQPLTVVGIAPPKFFGDRIDSDPPAFWIPLSAEPIFNRDNSILHLADANWLYAIGRIKPGVSPVALQSKLSAILRQFMASRPAYTENGASTQIPKQHVVLAAAGGGVQNLQQETGSGLRLLMLISGLVLLVACANVANLMLARATTRRQEISVRVALGAARARLIRQMLTESVVLACAGGLVGLAFAFAGTRTILALAFPNTKHLAIDAHPSMVVLGFAFALSLITGVVFGIVPALITSRSDPAEALRGANRSTRDTASLPQKALIVCQAALSLVLLVAAGLLSQTLRNLEHQNFGIATANRYVLHLDPAGAGYTSDKIGQLNDQLERDFSALPGVQSAGLALYSPLEGDNWGDSVFIEGRPDPGPTADTGSSWDRVSPRFFETVGQQIVRGRGITDQDTATSRMVAVVNQAFVKKFFPNQDPIGQHFGTFGQKYANSYEIVGVVADAKYNNPRSPVRPFFFRPITQQNAALTDPNAITGERRSLFVNSVTVRFQGNPQDLESMARRTLASINPDLTMIDFRSLDYQVAGNFSQEHLIARLTTLFGFLALILASVGLYGLTAYSVARRTSEIGVRMAMGANRQHILALIMRSAFLQTALGLAIGIPAAILGARVMAAQLYGVRSYDPAVLFLAVAVLGACAAVAGFVPAHRASGIEPMNALRTE
ncbi:MAG TPA: ABC transporter permease [Terriglobales bacterium]|nr:ABC transporter permease [Terriglobales bacterium]